MKKLASSTVRWASSLALGCALAASASAAPLLTQGIQAGGDAFLSGERPIPTPLDPDAKDVQQLADDFRFATGATISGFTWWGSAIETSKLTAYLLTGPIGSSNGSALQGSITQSAAPVTTGVGPDPLQPLDIYRFDFVLDSPLLAAADQQYFLSVWAGSNVWNWLQSDVPGKSLFRFDSGTDWFAPVEPNLSLEINGVLNGEVPEPSALALSALGLAAAAAVGRRRRIR